MKTRLFVLASALAALLVAAGPAVAAPGDPTLDITSPANNSVHKTTPAINFTSSGTNITRTCRLNIWAEPVECGTGWNPGPLADGLYTATVTVSRDDVPFVSDTVTFRVDATPPAIAITRSPDTEYTNAATTSASAVVSDATPSTLECWLAGPGWTPCPGGTNTTGTITVNHAEGTQANVTYSFRATDRAGNQTTLSHGHFSDRIAPTVFLSAGWGVLTNDATPSFGLAGNDTTGVSFTCSIDGATGVACSGPNWSTPELAEGVHTLVLTGRDAAGNTANTARNFTIDLTPPAVTLTALSGTQTKDTTPSFGFTATDAHNLETQYCGIDNDWLDGVECSDEFTAGELAVGQHTFFHEVADEAGNVRRSSLQFEIVSDPPPPLDGPGETPGPGGKDTPLAPSVAVKSKSSKIRRGRFTATITVTLRGAAALTACGAKANLKLAPKVKKAKPVKRALKLKVVKGACVGTVKLKLPAKFRGKKVGVQLSHAGAPQFAAVAFSGTLRRL